MPDFASMMGMMGGGMPGMGGLGGGVPPIADPETAYATQIQQLVDMGTVLSMRTAEPAPQCATSIPARQLVWQKQQSCRCLRC
jgi:hypothetical protein